MEQFFNLQTNEQSVSLKSIFYHFVLLVAGCIVFSIPLSIFWQKHMLLIHTGIELLCVFIVFSSFFIIFHVSQHKDNTNLLLALGFLIVGIFDLFHAFYFNGFSWYPPDHYDLSTKYWIFGRLTQGLLMLVVVGKWKLIINKYLGALMSFHLALGICLSLLYYPDLLPVLNIQGVGVTPLKVFLEYLTIVLFIISFFLLSKKSTKKEVITYRYLLIALLLAILAELSFTLYNSFYDYIKILGHTFRLCSYYYVFKGIYVSSITYPYEMLESSSKFMTRIYNHFPLAIVTYDQNGKITFANSRALEILGCTCHSIMGISLNAFNLRFNIRNCNRFPLNHETEKLIGQNRLCYLTNDDGKEYILSYNIYDLGNFGSFYILEDAKKEQKLENLQIQTRTLIDAIDNMVIICNQKQDIVMCNPAVSQILGYDLNQLIGENIRDLGEVLNYSNIMNRDILYHQITKHSFEVTIRRSDHKIITLEGVTSPICDVEKEVIGLIIVASDITEREQNRARIHQQEKLAIIGQMAAGIVHEIKNPLTSIKGFNQIILEKTEEDLTREFAEIIDEEVDAVNLVVSDFLAFAKPRKPKLVETTLSTLVKSIETMIESQLFVKGIDFELLLPSFEHQVMIDEAQLKQVILNMVKNAIDAMECTPQPKLTMTVSMIDKTGEMMISIRDNGKGIPVNDKGKLGMPFYTTKEKGTGLGLSICYQIIKENNGVITCESETGTGTVFHIILPCSTQCQLRSNDIA